MDTLHTLDKKRPKRRGNSKKRLNRNQGAHLVKREMAKSLIYSFLQIFGIGADFTFIDEDINKWFNVRQLSFP